MNNKKYHVLIVNHHYNTTDYLKVYDGSRPATFDHKEALSIVEEYNNTYVVTHTNHLECCVEEVI